MSMRDLSGEAEALTVVGQSPQASRAAPAWALRHE